MKRLLCFASALCATTFALAQIDTTIQLEAIDSCHFEPSCSWVIVPTEDPQVWQIGAVEKPGFDSAYSPPNALVTDTIAPYAVSSHSCVELDWDMEPYIEEGVTLSFTHRYETDSLIDGGFLEVAYNNGPWLPVLDTSIGIYVRVEHMYGFTDTLAGGHYGFSGNSGGWITSRIQWELWPQVARGTVFNAKVRFCFISDSIQTDKAGWLIDDIMFHKPHRPQAITEPKGIDALVIYPNPAADRLQLRFTPTNTNKHAFVIFNVLGQQMTGNKPLSTGNNDVDLSTFPAGTYIIQLLDAYRVVGYKQFVKQ